ncbi:MAG TPA: protein translocase subunit SecD [Candidatus Angelobacter sp.]|jgi:preprotein translocase subunit SecD|nr:protein translocase subunit SecD [Candidatus Angelobacter sp.]
MQKNLVLKVVSIIAILILFLYGIFGIPKRFNGAGLKEALLSRINLGLDLQGGTYLILQVVVNEAVSTETDHAVELLQEQLKKAGVTYTDISKPDDKNRPELITIKGVPPDQGSKLRTIVSDNLRDYDLVAGAEGSYNVVLKATAVNDIKQRAVAQSIEAIRRRIDALGVAEPTIQEHGLGDYQILVQLPSVDDPVRVKDIIQKTARLEFRHGLRGAQTYSSEEEARRENGGFLPPGSELLPGRSIGSKEGGADRYYLLAKVPVVSGTDVRSAEQSTKGDTNEPIVKFHLTTSAGNKFGAFTNAHNKETHPEDPSPWLAIVLDNRVIESASINSEIHDEGIIEGGFTTETAKELALEVNSGALPASLRYLHEQTVGPSLGADSIRAGVKAAIFGMLAVMIFMLVYYRGAGINADLALFLNLVILLGFLGLSGATLTLPGIAGVILTVGMGVDSNVLIFERIREELRNGKAPAAAVDQGFGRAWLTIIDTHVTTIVSAFILFLFGSGPVKGFAVTLTFGLLANLFTAVFVSRVIFDAILARKQRGEALSI